MFLGLAAFKPDRLLWLGLIGVLISIVGIGSAIVVRPTYAQMLKERPVVKEYINQVEQQLRDAFVSILSDSEFLKTKGRASLYVENNGWFICVARVSGNPDYARLGRVRLRRRNLDIISEAWGKGQCLYKNIPTGKGNSKEWENYHHEHHGMRISDLKKMRMKSRSYSGYQIKRNSTAVGVVMFESLNKNIHKTAPYVTKIQQDNNILEILEKLSTYSELVSSHA